MYSRDLSGQDQYLWNEELFKVANDCRRFSSQRFVQNWDTPLLEIHGQKDFRVSVEQGLQALAAAQVR